VKNNNESYQKYNKNPDKSVFTFNFMAFKYVIQAPRVLRYWRVMDVKS